MVCLLWFGLSTVMRFENRPRRILLHLPFPKFNAPASVYYTVTRAMPIRIRHFGGRILATILTVVSEVVALVQGLL